MQATQISLRNLKHSPLVTRRIQEKCEQLDRFHPHIRYCRVAIEQESERPGAHPFSVMLRIGIPGAEIVIGKTHDINYHLALRDAFAAARRELKEAASVRRGEVKPHAKPMKEAA